MPKKLKFHQAGIVPVMLILLAAVVVAVVGVVLYLSGVLTLPGKSTPTSSKSANDVQVELETKYDNPFDKSTQYQNPFSDYQNPFDELK